MASGDRQRKTRSYFIGAVVAGIALLMALVPAVQGQAQAKPAIDEKGDVVIGHALADNPDFNTANFDIRNYGFDDDGNPYLQVYGHAGRTVVPEHHEHEEGGEEHHELAYVYALMIENNEDYAKFLVVDSHAFEHDPAEDDERTNWHGQEVVFHKNVKHDHPDGHEVNGCYDVESVDTTSRINGKRMTIIETDATQILAAATLQILVVEHPDEDHDPFEPEIVCNAVDDVLFDLATLGTITK